MRLHMRTGIVFLLLAVCVLAFAPARADAADRADFVAGGRFVGSKGDIGGTIEFSSQGNKVVLIATSKDGPSQRVEGVYAIGDSGIVITYESGPTHGSGSLSIKVIDENSLENSGITFVREKAPASGEKAAGPESYELLAKDADLALAPGVILEPNSPPQNLGGWRTDGNVLVHFHFTVAKAGRYKATLVYSREPGGDAPVLLAIGGGENQSAQTTVASTGNWAEYREATVDSPLSIAAGGTTLQVTKNGYCPGSYLMNLRAIKLVLVE